MDMTFLLIGAVVLILIIGAFFMMRKPEDTAATKPATTPAVTPPPVTPPPAVTPAVTPPAAVTPPPAVTPAVTPPAAVTPPPVNCVVSNFSPCYKQKDNICMKTRTIVTPASNNGTVCPSLTEKCNETMCPIQAKTLVIRKTTTGASPPINIAELRVFNDKTQQINIPVANIVMSSIFTGEGADKYDAAKMLDKNVDTFAHTLNDTPKITIDLGSVQNITKIEIENRKETPEWFRDTIIELLNANGEVVWNTTVNSTAISYTFAF
jgi:hypothetical protein